MNAIPQSSAGLQGGCVYLVGAGPGDPELLTLKAARVIGEADVLVYDHLVSQAILDLVRPEAERIYAGKERGNHALPQEQLNDLLVRLASGGGFPVWSYWVAPFLQALLWPVASVVLLMPQRRAPDPDATRPL